VNRLTRSLTAHKLVELEELRVLCVTWNLGNAGVCEDILEELLPQQESFDIVVIATQENPRRRRPSLSSAERASPS